MQKLLFALLISLCSLCLLTGGLQAQAAPTPRTGTVNDSANLRAGPGTTYAIVGSAQTGQTVQIIGTNGDGTWYQLADQRWIAAFLATNQPQPTVQSGAATTGPQILAFTVIPTTTQNLGDRLTLTWEAKGEKVELCRLVITQLNCEPVPVRGQQTLTTDQNMLGITGFVLRVTTAGRVLTKLVELRLQCQNRYTWFFANPPTACPATAASLSPAAFQHFEHGLMIWVDGAPGQADDIFYLFFDESASQRSFPRTYVTLSAPFTLKAGASSDQRSGETPPPGRFEPVSGFGLLWRDGFVTDSAWGLTNVRARLGWALAPEEGYEFARQCEASLYPTCYLRLPGNQVLVTRPDSTAGVRQLWEQWR